MYITLKCRKTWIVLDVFSPRWSNLSPLKLSTHLMWGRDGAWSKGRIGVEVGTGTHSNPHGAWYPGAGYPGVVAPPHERLKDVS